MLTLMVQYVYGERGARAVACILRPTGAEMECVLEAGPFEGQVGPVAEIVPDKGKVKFTITVFGRETLVEADHTDLEKIL